MQSRAVRNIVVREYSEKHLYHNSKCTVCIIGLRFSIPVMLKKSIYDLESNLVFKTKVLWFQLSSDTVIHAGRWFHESLSTAWHWADQSCMGRVLRQERAAVGTTEARGGHPTGVHLSENRLRCDKGKQKGVLQRNWRER